MCKLTCPVIFFCVMKIFWSASLIIVLAVAMKSFNLKNMLGGMTKGRSNSGMPEINIDKFFNILAAIIIVPMILMFAVAIVGIIGAVRGNLNLLSIYALTTVAIAIPLLGFSIDFSSDIMKNMRGEPDDSMSVHFKNYDTDPRSKQKVDKFRQKYECCSFKREKKEDPLDGLDLIGSYKSRTEPLDGSYPSSCCPGKPPQCTAAYKFTTSCEEVLRDKGTGNPLMMMLMGIIGSIGPIPLIAIIATLNCFAFLDVLFTFLVLYKAYKKKKEEME